MKIHSRKIDLVVVLAIIAIATVLILQLELKFLVTGILYLMAPSLYLVIRNTWDVRNILAASFVSIPPGFIFSFLHTLNQSWFIPESQLIIPYRVFGILPVDEILWYFMFTFAITTFYEHFIEKRATGKVSGRLKYVVLGSAIAFGVILLLYVVAPSVLHVRYSYAVFSLIFLIPLFYLFTKKPLFISKFARAGVFFFFLFFVCELVAVKTGQWIFPGEYLGMITFSGIQFPFEEFFFWIMISSMGFLSYYELFVDDEK